MVLKKEGNFFRPWEWVEYQKNSIEIKRGSFPGEKEGGGHMMPAFSSKKWLGRIFR